ncbi:MAG: glycosyltransferase [Anaerolineaceae bacterium]|nr:glycosyltransferase [Anaerolineaceae bacterium]
MTPKSHTRIAIISEHASPLATLGGTDSGGQNVYVNQIARHLPRHNFAVDIFTRRDARSLPEVVELAEGVRLIHVPAGPPHFIAKEGLLPLMDDFTRFVIGYSRRFSYALLHANFWMSALVAADVKRATGIPFVVTFHALGRVRRRHQGEADGFPDDRFAIEERVVREADAIIAECPQDHEDLCALYRADPQRITMIPAGFDPQEFAPMNQTVARLALNLPLERPLLLQLGRMVPRKGVANVIRSLRHLRDGHGVTAQLMVVGGEADEPDPQLTPEIGRLQAIAAEEGVADQVTFVGRRGRHLLRHYYNAADIFISTPWYEPFGITPVEAMACGTAVIGSQVGGIQYTIRDGETGYLVPPKDPAALAEKAARLLQDPDLRRQMGEAGVRRANELFTWAKVTRSIAELYHQVASRQHDQRTPQQEELHLIERSFSASMALLQHARQILPQDIHAAAWLISRCFASGGKVLVCGNGGSAAEAQHLAAELVGRFKLANRPGLPALALTADTAVLTAWSNDIGYDDVFARQVQAFGQPGDLLLGFSTSGQSPNLVQAFKAAQRQGLTRVALLGGDGGAVAKLSDKAIVIPTADAQRVQEAQVLVLHLLCELVELWLPKHATQTANGRPTNGKNGGNGHYPYRIHGKRNGRIPPVTAAPEVKGIQGIDKV